jgi:hypothetical protein
LKLHYTLAIVLVDGQARAAEETGMADELPQPNMLAQVMQTHPVQIYFNHFVNNIGPGDISTILWRNAVPVGVLNMSATTAKTLAVYLMEAVATLEKHLGHEIMKAPDLIEKMNSDSPATE